MFVKAVALKDNFVNMLKIRFVGMLFLTICFVNGSESKCLKEYADINDKRTFYYNGMSLPVIIESSDRVSSLFTNNILYILLTEVLRYKTVKMIYKDHPTEYLKVIARLTKPPEEGVLKSMVNLEVWLPRGFRAESDDVVDAGPLGPVGMYGWFVPSSEVENLWRRSGVVLNHWRALTLTNVTRAFSLDSHVHAVQVGSTLTTQSERTWCDLAYDGCQKGILVVNRTLCHGIYDHSCALLLSSNTEVDRGFIVEEIEKLNLRSRVAWIGDNLRSFLTKMIQADVPVMFFNWIPNDVTSIANFELVRFPHHFDYKHSSGNPMSKQYVLTKMMWKDIKSHLPEVHRLVSLFHFDQEDLEHELSKFPMKWSDGSIQQLACDWLKYNPDKWKSWIPWNAARKTPIHLVGLFPKLHPSIKEGALMAVEMLNDNDVTLKDYEIVMLASTTPCNKEVTARQFLHSVQNTTHRVAAFIGPSCNEAAAPLVSLSSYFNKIVISLGPKVAVKQKPPCLFFNVVPSADHLGDVYINILGSFNWSQVAVIVQDDDDDDDGDDDDDDDVVYKPQYPLLKEKFLLSSVEVLFEGHVTTTSTNQEVMDVVQALVTSRARVFVLLVDDRTSFRVLCRAFRMGLSNSHGFVWFVSHGLTDVNFANLDVECSVAELYQALKGSFIVEPSSFGLSEENISIGSTTVGDWVDLYLARLDALGMRRNLHGGYAFDAVVGLGLALNQLIEEDPSCVESLDRVDTARRLSSQMKQLNFIGATGPVRYEGPQRIGSFDIKQIQENGSVMTIGRFDFSKNIGGQMSMNLSLGTFPHHLLLSQIIRSHSCSVEGVRALLDLECDAAIIIVSIVGFSLLLVSVMGCLALIKRRYDLRMRTTCDRMEELGLFSQDTSWLCLDQWEVPRDNVVLNRKLGEGAFGTVFGGEANVGGVWMAAAVKTLKISSKPDEKLNFLSEAEMMKHFGHENIVKLLGVCTRGEPTLAIMEFMLHGDLKTFLLSRRQLVGQSGREAEDVSPLQLTKMALDVAHGLLYLSSLNYVHRDLACRNCLVHANKTIKIGDFGMTRPMNESDYYRFNKRGMFPVRWMAPESLSDGLFGTTSDVWSYGVLLYEIITFASFPYQGLSNRQVLNFVKNGNILSMPTGCPPKMESLLKRCWAFDPKNRPKVIEIIETLNEMPTLLVPCLDTPSTSLNIDGPWSLEMNLLPRVRHRNQYQKNLLVSDRMSAPASTLNPSINVVSPRLSSPPFCRLAGDPENFGDPDEVGKFGTSSCDLSARAIKELKNSDRHGSGTAVQCEMDESFLSQDTTHLCQAANICAADATAKEVRLPSVKRSLSADDKTLFDARHWGNVSSRIYRLYADKIRSKIEEIKKVQKSGCEKSSVKRRTLLPVQSGLDEQEGFATEPRQNNRKSVVGPQQLTCDSRTDSDYCSQHSKDFSAHIGTALL